jgi:hypothetical protein
VQTAAAAVVDRCRCHCHCHCQLLPLQSASTAATIADRCRFRCQTLSLRWRVPRNPEKGEECAQLVTSDDKDLLIKSETMEIFQKMKIFQ